MDQIQSFLLIRFTDSILKVQFLTNCSSHKIVRLKVAMMGELCIYTKPEATPFNISTVTIQVNHVS